MIKHVPRVAALLLCLYTFCFSPFLFAQTPCKEGKAGDYTCAAVDLQAFVAIKEMGGGANTEANDIWGWTDPETGREFALVGLTDGTAFVDVTSPTKPVYLGILPTHSISSIWRDIKVYKDHAYIVADNAREHGMQVFELQQLLNLETTPAEFQETAHYDDFGSAHNIVINEETGFAYVVGSSTCAGGLHMIDLSTPAKPVNAGCFSGDGYTHDAQCVVYRGPDPDYKEREVCVNANEDTITLVDVTDKAKPYQISRVGYPDAAYVHQGWFSEDQRFFYQNDELDEGQRNTRTIIWDLTDLDDPYIAKEYFGATAAIDHNLYVKDNYVFESNYTAGLRILDVSEPEAPKEVAYFDTYPSHDRPTYNGAWSAYPYFKSGNVIVNSIEAGLFVVKPLLGQLPVELVDFAVVQDGDVVYLRWETAGETNNAGFEIQQQIHGDYVQIGYVAGHGTTDIPQSYVFEASNPGPGVHAYRLKQIDFNGTYAFSPVASLTIDAPASLTLSEAYPNPFNPETSIELSVALTQDVQVEVYNFQGQRVAVLFDGQMEANEARNIRMTAASLPSGAYLVRARGEHEVVTRTVTLIK